MNVITQSRWLLEWQLELPSFSIIHFLRLAQHANVRRALGGMLGPLPFPSALALTAQSPSLSDYRKRVLRIRPETRSGTVNDLCWNCEQEKRLKSFTIKIPGGKALSILKSTLSNRSTPRMLSLQKRRDRRGVQRVYDGLKCNENMYMTRRDQP